MPTITVNGQEIPWEGGMTIRTVLNKMNYSFRMLVIKVNDKLVKKEDWDSFQVPPGADVKVIHLISGG